MLTFDEKLRLLRINSFLGKASSSFLCELAAAAREHSFDKNEFIFAKSDPAEDFYILVDGKVGHPEVQAGDDQFLVAHRVTATSQMFGFAAAVEGRPTRVVSARCELPTRVLTIDGRWFQALCKSHGDEGHALLQELTRAHAGYERIVLGRSGWLSVRNAGKIYGPPHRPVVALHDCSFEIRPGEFCAIAAPAGCGKSALAKAIAGFDTLTDGVIYLDGELINRPGGKPKPGLNRILIPGTKPRFPQGDLIDKLIRPLRGQKSASSEVAARERLLFARFGLDPAENLRPGELTPALRFRTEIILALCNEPDLVLLDDPLRGFGAQEKSELHSFLVEIHGLTRKTFLFLTRELDEAIYLSDRVLLMSSPPGRIIHSVHVDWPKPRNLEFPTAPEFQRLRQELLDAATAHQAPPDAAMEAKWRQEARDEVSAREQITAAAIRLPRPLPAPVNSIKESLRDGRFFWTIEFIPSVDKILRDELNKLGGIAEAMRDQPVLAGFAVTDRVHSDRDPDPVAAASHLLDHSGKEPLVHFSGKGRDMEDLYGALERMKENGLENMLFISGDRLKQETRGERAPYLESVPAIQAAKQAEPNLLVAAAVNPFKYREEDAMAQYLKLGKKVGAGADFIITQIGFDMLKYEEAIFWVDTRNYRVPLVANVMPMPARRARYIRQHQLAGVTVTDSFLALIEAEERLMPDKGASRVLRRLALQILGVRYYGYAGVQITGIHSREKLAALQGEIAALTDLCSDRITWNKAWEESLTLPEGGRANPVPPIEPWYLVNPRTRRARKTEIAKFQLMDRVHGLAFDKGPAARILASVFRPVERNGKLDYFLERLERTIKAPLFGCETCGMCRLAETQYVCPETCPKGLANGACGGTTENLCEFRDRECIHSVKYRIAKEVGVLDQLEKWLIPAVPKGCRHTSSWPPHFRGEGPQTHVIDFPSPKKTGARV